MPRYPEGHREQTRERIVEAAAAAYRTGGLSRVSVQAVMQSAGLTHGGFYAHFGGREELVLAALDLAARQKLDALMLHARQQPEPLAAFIRGYLSRSHRDHPEDGCLLPSLTAEVSREGGELRSTLALALKVLVAAVQSLGPGLTEARAQTLVSGLVGSLMLARALPDREASDALLLNARRTLLETSETGGPDAVSG